MTRPTNILHVIQPVRVPEKIQRIRQICCLLGTLKKLKVIRLSSCTLDPAGAPPQTPILGSFRIIFQIKITRVSTVSASSEGLHLASYTNDQLLKVSAFEKYRQ